MQRGGNPWRISGMDERRRDMRPLPSCVRTHIRLHKKDERRKSHVEWVTTDECDVEPSSRRKWISPARNVLLYHIISTQLTQTRSSTTSSGSKRPLAFPIRQIYSSCWSTRSAGQNARLYCWLRMTTVFCVVWRVNPALL